MTEVTTNGIVKWTNRDPASIVQASQAQGDSVETALSKRERFDFVWANSAERIAQTGMVQGSRGYQVDTKSEYLHDNSSWRLAISYAEFSSATSASVPTATWGDYGTISLVASASTDTTFAVPSTNTITLVNPGVYAISAYNTANLAMTGSSSFTIIGDSTLATSDISHQIARGDFVGASRVQMMALPFYLTATTNQVLYFYWQNNSGANRTMTSTIRIGRLG